MNILFLSLIKIKSIDERGLYTDLLRQFVKDGHQVYILSPLEKRLETEAQIIHEKGTHIHEVQIGNIQKTNFVEKGISTLFIEKQFLSVVKKQLHNVKFDLLLYPTPPITFVNVIRYVKNRDNAKSYLLLKDIFPQNSIDINILKKNGIKGIIYNYFRKKEKDLYRYSDYIGCMSDANVRYLLQHNREIKREKVEICPNSIEIVDRSISKEKREEVRKKYGIPEEKVVCIYGGNLGKPQGVDYLISCLQSERNNKDVFFLIVGNGTEYVKLDDYINSDKPKNVCLLKTLPKREYEELTAACDVGLIFLDYRFTIPNFPSRLLSYMRTKIPVLACTDLNTDVKDAIEDGKFGWWNASNDVHAFNVNIEKIKTEDRVQMGENAFAYLCMKYDVNNSYQTIMKHMR